MGQFFPVVRQAVVWFVMLFAFGASVSAQDAEPAPQPVATPASPPAAPPADPKVRAKLLRDYARSATPEIGPIAAYLRDPDMEVKRVAVESIVRLGGIASVAPLSEATRISDEEIQIRATDGIVNFYSPGYIQQGLSASLKRAGSAVQSKFVTPPDVVIDHYVEVVPDAAQSIANLVSGGISLTVRANAARAAGILRAKVALPDLYSALRTKDSRVLFESLVAIRKIGDRSAGPEIAFLLRDLDENVQVAAIEATGLLQNKEAMPRLREVYEMARSRRVKRAAMDSLAKMIDDSNRPLFEVSIKDADEGIRSAAADGLARLAQPQDAAVFKTGFESEKKMEPRLSFAYGLVRLGDVQMLEFSPLRYLTNTLNSAAYHGVAEPYLLELSRLDAPRNALKQALPTMNRVEKARILTIFGQVGAADLEDTLLAMSRDADTEVARAAAKALRNLRTQRP
jgi:HEAT repeat protein